MTIFNMVLKNQQKRHHVLWQTEGAGGGCGRWGQGPGRERERGKILHLGDPSDPTGHFNGRGLKGPSLANSKMRRTKVVAGNNNGVSLSHRNKNAADRHHTK